MKSVGGRVVVTRIITVILANCCLFISYKSAVCQGVNPDELGSVGPLGPPEESGLLDISLSLLPPSLPRTRQAFFQVVDDLTSLFFAKGPLLPIFFFPLVITTCFFAIEIRFVLFTAILS